MEGHAKSSEKRNDALSQSYIQGVERVAQRSNVDAGFSFNLPPQIIEEREKAWSSFFDKYADEASDDVELNIKTMKPVTNKGSADKDEEEDVEHRQYYSKCRAPIRKLPALIQYWVDTGNPPYQLTGEEDHSDTGSSLSEGEYSRSRQSAVLRESIENPKVDEFSPYSSVDTAAYVLSNANVTKKAQAQEIIEGAKRPNKQLSAEILSANENGTNVSVTVDGAPTAPNDAQTNNSLNSPQSQGLTNTPLSQGSSVMLSEVLPALQQFDELLEKSKQLKSPRSALSKVRRIRKPAVVEQPNVAEPANSACDKERQKNSLDLSENSARKTVSLRKLYTGRNSPVDLIMARTSTESTVTTGPNSHPALEPENRSKSQVPLFISRARARRKRKRASVRQSTGIPTLRSNNSQESQEPVLDDGNNNNDDDKKGTTINEAKEGHERYTDFFESLGLTPSKTIIGKDEEIGGGPMPNTGRKIAKRIENKGNESQDSSSQNLATSPKTVADAANDGSEIIGNKVLSVRIVRLPEECLYRYGQVKGQSPVALPCALTDKKNLNIELLTTMTHDSDSSTILICSCNPSNNYQSSDSDCSLFTQSINRSASESHRGDRNSNFETSESALHDIRSSESPRQISDKLRRNSASFETTPKPFGVVRKSSNARDLVVRLDKLANNELPNVTKPANEIPRGFHNKALLQVSSPVAKTVDAFDPAKPMGTETTCVTIGSRVFGESSRFEASKLKPAKPTRTSFDRSFGMCLDDDDDSFARLVQEFGSTQRGFDKKSRKGLNDTGQGIIDAKMNGVLKEPEEKIPRLLTRSRRVTGIASSSDENEDEVIKIDKASKRTSRKIDRKRTRDLPNRENEREEVIGEHVKNLTNNGEAIVGIKNRLKKPVGKLNCDKVSMESYETNDFGRSVRPKFVSMESTEPKRLPCKPKQVENVFGTRDEVRSKNSLDELTNAQTRSNSERQKIRIPRDETNDDKPSRITRSARFHTLLNSDTDSHSENENSVITEQPLSRANQPLNRTNVFTDEISTDRKTTVDKLRDLTRRRKNALENLDDPISEFVTAVPERDGESSRLLPPSCNLSSKDSSEDLTILHSRSRKKKEEPRLKPISRRKGRRTRILGTPIESESDEDERKQLQKAQTNGALQPHEDVQTDERNVKCLPDTTANKDNSGREKRLKRSKHSFPYIFDDMNEDVDLIFSGNGDGQATMNDHMTRNSNLETPKICKNMINARESTRTFRTRLSCVSDDDNVL